MFMKQVHLWPPEEQASYPGHPPAAVPEGGRPDSGPQRGWFLFVLTVLYSSVIHFHSTSLSQGLHPLL